MFLTRVRHATGLDGAAYIGQQLDRDPKLVSRYARANAFPYRHFPKLREVSARLGIEFDERMFGVFRHPDRPEPRRARSAEARAR